MYDIIYTYWRNENVALRMHNGGRLYVLESGYNVTCNFYSKDA